MAPDDQDAGARCRGSTSGQFLCQLPMLCLTPQGKTRQFMYQGFSSGFVSVIVHISRQTGRQSNSFYAFMLSIFTNCCFISCEADRYRKASLCFSCLANGCRSRPRSRSMTNAIMGLHPRQTNDQMLTSRRIWAFPNPTVAMHLSSLQILGQPCAISGCPIQSLLSSEGLSDHPSATQM